MKRPPGGLRLSVSPMTPRHLEPVLDLEEASFPHPWSRAVFQAEIISPRALPLVALTLPNEKLIAYLILWQEPGEVQVQNLAVDPLYWRRGVARHLLGLGLEEAKKRGLDRAVLEVRPSNIAARRLYASLGFRETGRKPGYYRPEGEDAICLACRL